MSPVLEESRVDRDMHSVACPDYEGDMYLLRVPSFRIEINPGNHNGGETPDPIPNSEVKPSGADGTAWATAWESRSLPGFLF